MSSVLAASRLTLDAGRWILTTPFALAVILGGRGNYLGTVCGVILITLLQSILSIMQMPDAGRQVIYGAVIIAMLLVYGRERSTRV